MERIHQVYFTRMKTPLVEELRPLLHTAVFGFAASIINGAKVDQNLVNALLERWRPETHTFHFPCGEATITLQDVALHLGLPIDGDAITGFADDDWGGFCLHLLGVAPDRFDGGRVSLKWLEETFANLPPC